MNNKIKPWKMNDMEQTAEHENDDNIIEYKEPSTIEIVNNRIYFYSDIDRKNSLSLLRALKDKENELILKKIVWEMEEEPIIHLHIQSYGGYVHAGLSLYDTIRTMKLPVYTYVDGVCASAATLLSLAGKKRFIQKNSFMLVHQIRVEMWGVVTYDELIDQKTNDENLMRLLEKVYLSETKIPKKIFKELMKKDLYLNADQALVYGFVDSIIG